jgi:inosine-uridine nucleoside N-ribohydrolase
MVERVIIDTDPGVDDMMCLFLAFSSSELIIEGVTIVYGNHHDTALLAHNASLAIQMAKMDNIKVYKGATKPLEATIHTVGGILVHGQNGIGNIDHTHHGIDKVDLSVIDTSIDAPDFIIKSCTENSGQITLVLLGPMTNAAIALQRCPDLKKHVKKIVVMAGAFNFAGNVSPVAEANAHNDPLAAKIVFTSGIQVVCAPLNVSTQVHMTNDFMDELRQMGGVGSFIADIAKHYLWQQGEWGVTEFPIHDSCTIMSIIRPDVFTETKQVFVDVETQGELTRGVTLADWRGHYKKKECYALNTTILWKVDQEKFKKEYLKRIQSLVDRVGTQRPPTEEFEDDQPVKTEMTM